MMDFAISLTGSLCVAYFAWASWGLMCAVSSQRACVLSRGQRWKLRLDRREAGRRGSDRVNAEGWSAEVVELQPAAPSGPSHYPRA
jgi:hypothetical protein